MQTLTSQLNVSNPVLTAISDAMTAEGEAMAKLESAVPVSIICLSQRIMQLVRI
jgi:hypothetical protein